MSRVRASSSSSTSMHLEIPRKSMELEDPGAHDLSSEDEFQDAPEGRRKTSRPVTPASPVPITRVEKVDDEPSHGEVPGTPAYNKRRQDAVPDEIEVVPEGTLSKRSSRQFLDTPTTPGGSVIPRTIVEKVDPGFPSYGEEPGTPAYRQRLADAAPDLVLKNPDPTRGPKYTDRATHSRNTSNLSIPETIVTRVDDEPAHGEVPNTVAAALRRQDASPDKVKIDRDVSADSSNERDDFDDNDHDDAFADDFDDFEEGAQASTDDDFGDFGHLDELDPRLQHSLPQLEPQLQPQSHNTFPLFPLADFDALSSLPDLLESTKLHLDTMFPTTTTPSPEPFIFSDSIPADSLVFPTDRSRSLWQQLITPPPLQPPNWTQSRIRRLFLISLGVPVDLDEILPPSKQKKLILPDIDLASKTSATNDDNSTGRPENESISKLRSSTANNSTASLDSQQSATATPTATPAVSRQRGRERPKSVKMGAPQPPALDLNAVKRLCATTDEKLDGLTDNELKGHVRDLEALTERTSHVLEYWLKKRDGLRKEKEAFEGVIENLVRHAKRVRTAK